MNAKQHKPTKEAMNRVEMMELNSKRIFWEGQARKASKRLEVINEAYRQLAKENVKLKGESTR